MRPHGTKPACSTVGRLRFDVVPRCSLVAFNSSLFLFNFVR